MTEQITDELVKEASNNITNVVKYKCGGKTTHLKLVDMSKDNTSKILDQALSNFVQDFKIVELAPSSTRLKLLQNQLKIHYSDILAKIIIIFPHP